jgi:alanine dehydrogenase
MIIGVPRETGRDEHRVGLSPFAVSRLTQLGHAVVIEKDAGNGAHFYDRDYQRAGAQTVYSLEEVYRRSDVVCRVSDPGIEESRMLKPGTVVFGFQHLAVAPRELLDCLREQQVTLVGYELIVDDEGESPVLLPFSEMAGQMVIQLASRYLQNEEGGRGILMGSVPAVAPPTVLILGAGRVGHAAARDALHCGAHTIVIDSDMGKLRRIHDEFHGNVVTIAAGTDRLEKFTSIADVVVGAVLIPGGRAPFVVSEEMVKGMKQGSVIIDVAIDQGGCVETSRPTTLADPTYVVHGVVHYCVPNMTANVARTASRALASAALPYIVDLVTKGERAAFQSNPGLRAGIYLHRGVLVNRTIGETFGVEAQSIDRLLAGGDES